MKTDTSKERDAFVARVMLDSANNPKKPILRTTLTPEEMRHLLAVVNKAQKERREKAMRNEK